jgi:hypothetical protein
MAEGEVLATNTLSPQVIDFIGGEFWWSSNPECGPKIFFGSAVSLHRFDQQTIVSQAAAEVFIPQLPPALASRPPTH